MNIVMHWTSSLLCTLLLYILTSCNAQQVISPKYEVEEGGDVTLKWTMTGDLLSFKVLAQNVQIIAAVAGDGKRVVIRDTFLKDRLKEPTKVSVTANQEVISVIFTNLTLSDNDLIIKAIATFVVSGVPKEVENIANIEVFEKGNKPGDKGSNTGVIVGAVFGAIAFIVLIAVVIFLYLRWKKNQSKTPNSERMSALDKRQPDEGSHYASTEAAVPQQKREQVIYAPLGAGGGRVGPRSEPEKSNYAEVKVDEQGYPVGPAPPDKPERGVERDNGDDDEGFTSGIVV